VKQPIDGFIKIETEEDPKHIALDAAQVAGEAPNLQEITASPRGNASIKADNAVPRCLQS
jgi:hypothetical protein